MTPNQSFENKILSILKDSPDSNAADFIRRIKSNRSLGDSLFSTFEEFAYKVGIGIIAEKVYDHKFNFIGCTPYLKYYPDNLLGEESREVKLFSDSTLYNLNDCYTHLAKALIYRMSRVASLHELVNEK
ncbi:hypothetical protein JM658_05955 [Joostella atrarenae]|uniref:Uncharacterized protein n=1 Tax=Joostella atrarenae TaxID=679257 RepID=A0ABS9J1P9_9FLAO|nr:hypothetical protein [Joostella atrarenae]MCF8714370.1 hypothetical protein [Joostella atrarenae]